VLQLKSFGKPLDRFVVQGALPPSHTLLSLCVWVCFTHTLAPRLDSLVRVSRRDSCAQVRQWIPGGLTRPKPLPALPQGQVYLPPRLPADGPSPYCRSPHCPLGFSSGAQGVLHRSILAAHRQFLSGTLLPLAPPPLVVGPKVHRSAGLRAPEGLPKGSSQKHRSSWSQLIRGHAGGQNRFLLSDFKHFSPSFQGSFHFSLRYLFAIGLPLIFSLRWDLPSSLDCTTKQSDSLIQRHVDSGAALTGLSPSVALHSRRL